MAKKKGRKLSLEPLEHRMLLSVDPNLFFDELRKIIGDDEGYLAYSRTYADKPTQKGHERQGQIQVSELVDVTKATIAGEQAVTPRIDKGLGYDIGTLQVQTRVVSPASNAVNAISGSRKTGLSYFGQFAAEAYRADYDFANQIYASQAGITVVPKEFSRGKLDNIVKSGGFIARDLGKTDKLAELIKHDRGDENLVHTVYVPGKMQKVYHDPKDPPGTNRMKPLLGITITPADAVRSKRYFPPGDELLPGIALSASFYNSTMVRVYPVTYALFYAAAR